MRDTDIWDKTSLTDLLKEIHTSTLDKRVKIENIIDSLQGFMTDASTATVIAPLIKDYFDVLVRSDEHMVKVATIVQRAITAEVNTPDDDPFTMLTDEDMKKLNASANDALKELTVASDITDPVVIMASGSKA